MSHYYAERFFAPTLISPIINKENLEVWAVCDSPTGSLSLQMSALHWTSFATTNSSETSVQGCPSAGAQIQVFFAVLRILASEEDRIYYDKLSKCIIFVSIKSLIQKPEKNLELDFKLRIDSKFSKCIL